jgi:hypothetical protein
MAESLASRCGEIWPQAGFRLGWRQYKRKKTKAFPLWRVERPSNCVFFAATRTKCSDSGGDERNRTVNPLLAKQVLCQLSYIPERNFKRIRQARHRNRLKSYRRIDSLANRVDLSANSSLISEQGEIMQRIATSGSATRSTKVRRITLAAGITAIIIGGVFATPAEAKRGRGSDDSSSSVVSTPNSTPVSTPNSTPGSTPVSTPGSIPGSTPSVSTPRSSVPTTRDDNDRRRQDDDDNSRRGRGRGRNRGRSN